MQLSIYILSALALLVPVLAAPSSALLTVQKYDGATSGRYIVRLKPSVNSDSFLKTHNITATHQWTIINGFASKLSGSHLDNLRSHPDVEYISEDGIGYTSTLQTNAPWGLARLSSVDKLANKNSSALTFAYEYDAQAGAAVDVYVIDTGVNIQHASIIFIEFGGRARWGASFGGYPQVDVNGHGTHCAGTVAGRQYGVAKAASIIAVRVTDDNGRVAASDAISGMDYALNATQTSGRPGVTSISLCFGVVPPLDSAVAKLTSGGVHVVVAACNDNRDAVNNSPARAPTAITVGATSISDSRAYFSNYGSVVDIFAPGQDITSAWIGSTIATNRISGTSMATPHISGLVALLIGRNGNITPAAMAIKIKSLSLKNILTDIPSGTVNQLAQNGLAPA